MKNRPAILLAASLGGCALFWASSALSNEAESRGDEKPAPVPELSAEQAAELRAKIDHASQEIKTRLNMPSLIEILPDEEGEVDFISELEEAGWIVEATVEEVEAALKAAADTPSFEDDIAARRLAHRASCRFYFRDPGGEVTRSAASK